MKKIHRFISRVKLAAIFAAADLFVPRLGLAALNLTGPNGILCTVAQNMFWILIILSTIMVLYAGFVYMTAGSDAQNVSKAHKILTYAAIGIVIALIAKGFPKLIATAVGVTLPNDSTC